MAEVNGASTASPNQPAPIAQPQMQPAPNAPAGLPSKDDHATHNVDPLPPHPTTSASDSGMSTRPRDARTIHMILSAMGVQSYQERVPLQLLDFAYRYTAGILSEAQHLSQEGYSTGTSSSGGRGAASHDEIGLNAVRLAASSRPSHQFSGGQLSKESLLEMAAERNKVRLPAVDPQGPKFGLRLPQERFLLNGRGWEMAEEWESEGDEEQREGGKDNPDIDMAENEDADEGEGNMEDVFGREDNEEDRMEE